MNNKKILSILIIVLIIIGGVYYLNIYNKANGSDNQTITKVSFGYQPFGNNLAFFVAMDKGFFKEANIDVTPVKIISANDAATAIINGSLIGNATVPLNVLLNIEENEPGLLKIFMIKTTSREHWSDYLLVKKDSNIKSIEQLRGKKIGGYPGTAQQSLIKLVLTNFMNENDFITIELSPTTQLQALETGQVDAILTYDELAVTALENGIADILVENPLSKYVTDPIYGFPYVLSTKFIKEKPEVAKGVIKAMNKSSEFIKNNEEEARQIMTNWSNTKPEIAKKVNLWDQVKAENIDKEALQKLADIFYEAGITEKKINTDSLIISAQDI